MVSIIFPLLLQKPSPRSKAADHIRYLEKRLIMWKNGQVNELIGEGRAIQKRLSRKKIVPISKEKRFVNLMEEGRVSAALRCIGSLEAGLLECTPEVLAELKQKHPEPKNAVDGSKIQGPLPKQIVEDVLFESIDAEAIFKTAMKVTGSGGPSGADAKMWHRILCSKQFKRKPANLCQAVAELTRRLNRDVIPSPFLRAFVAGRLIPLDKKPGVRPIAIGEVLRRIASTATISLLKPELIQCTAPIQTCAGIAGGVEASIHTMRRMYEDESTEAILVDASNAFNSLNQKAALHNIKYTCPELYSFVHNLYQCEAELMLPNSDEIVYSSEGTAQGGPESMGFYAASTVPLITASHNVKKIFYADDGSGSGSLEDLRDWWCDLKDKGPLLGYCPNASKTWLIVKPDHLERAQEQFPDINVTAEGHRYLGSFIGTAEASKKFVADEVASWEKDINDLVKIAKSEPQLAYSGYIYGMSKRWQFLCRTTPGITEEMKVLEQLIRKKLIPSITGISHVSDDMRMILRLPARMGGLGFLDPSEDCGYELQNSTEMTSQITEAIFHQNSCLQIDEEQQKRVVQQVRRRKESILKDQQREVLSSVGDHMCRIVMLAAEKGASSWLTSLPLKVYGFRFSKQQFVDAISMRYELKMKDVPRVCACGQPHSISHCLSCKKGGFVHMRHNVVRDTLADLLKETCKDVCVEPQLLPVTGEELPVGTNVADGARSDISAVGFWQPLTKAFFDIRIFNPLAQSNAAKPIPDMYRHHETTKKKEYNARIIEVEKGTFTPVVFSCNGGASPESSRLLKHLALKLSVKRREQYSSTINFIRRRICFDVLRSCLISFRGDRGHVSRDIEGLDIGMEKLVAY